LKKVRPIALALPGVIEKRSHGSPTFFTGEGKKGRTFASLHDEREYFEGRLCIWAASEEAVRDALIEDRPDVFFVPPYVGHRGWIGMRLDTKKVDWDEVAGVIEDAQALIVG
jgi:hypothetical protein